MNIEDFKSDDWIKIWAGAWSFLTCSYWGERYTRDYVIGGKVFLHRTIFFLNEGKSSCFVTQEDKDIFGKNLAAELVNNPERAKEITAEVRRQTDAILDFIAAHEGKDINEATYNTFWEIQDTYYKPHINMKFVTDYLPQDVLEQVLPDFESARVRAEPVFKRTEEFIAQFAEMLAKEHGYMPSSILSLTNDELADHFSGKPLPGEDKLQKRYRKSAQLYKDGERLLVTSYEVKKVEELVLGDQVSGILKGVTAYPGKVQGVVRMVLDPTKADNFQEGDILVTGMTRPEYLQLMHKAGAFITDAGGVLSHAAIVARELKKPCIIGTKFATTTLKDGDVVEVDADKGVVRVIK